MEEKMSMAEIEKMRQRADQERNTRRDIQRAIKHLREGKMISFDTQLRVLQRGQKPEIEDMLRAYAGIDSVENLGVSNKVSLMSEEAQLFIYENWKDSASPYHEFYEFMIEDIPYTDKLATRLIDNKEFTGWQKLSPDVECYYLDVMLAKSDDYKAGFFDKVVRYFENNGLAPKTESMMIWKYLRVENPNPKYCQACHNVVRKYILSRKKLTEQGEHLLIDSGKHDLIMLYIHIAEEGLKEENKLFERGNREEITAYFERYVKL